ncbi:hypothetical protein EKL30_02545 [Candidimonas sp. SYP-B2681]|uniref:hypothetical protein n=1 Tax=Candidimonas sp. SYP-B2681 TaxID=2497686 RepID=UPI000F8844D1|nr:hypothetical protein [Candidimonas sp. SYP-B2681]RTZ47877.1 hypothetical protein EKL30_02545 [Candidimonas sp. SYP-B2681]
MQRSKFSVSIKLATLTAALALCGAAYAATGTVASTASAASEPSAKVTSSTSDNRADHHHKSGDHHKSMRGHRDAAMWVPGYGPLDAKFVESLALNESQTKLLQEAQAEQKADKSARRDTMRAARTEKLEQVKTGKIDPRAALKQADEAHKQATAKRSKLNEKWLSVWDSLDATQHQKVTARLNERAEKFAKRAEKHKQHQGAQDSAKISS